MGDRLLVESLFPRSQKRQNHSEVDPFKNKSGMFGGIHRFQLVHVAMSSETFEMVEMLSTPAMVETCSEHSIRDVDLFDTWPPKISSCLAQQIYSELSFE